ncbi:AMP-binding protein [Actinocorallia sp. API 0066]|uniref:phenylacetate--CoA ligase family protein n=1 Tax=Actinocorallia sp. API 0066 TaxID=2896846 RepID=UPI001E3B3D27|nr:AMP-binding protein [Actinocorallia sp. API 0066]MCD0447749.1 AMP-binding protein [Actinocorallia sp. API 0066]
MTGFLDAHAALHAAYEARTLTDGELAAWRETRLRAVLARVVDGSPFYRERLRGLDLASVPLAELPFTTKADLRDAGYGILSGPPSDARIFYETTGTTGPPTPCPRGHADIVSSNRSVAAAFRRQVEARFGARRPVVALMGPSELYAFGDVFTAVTEELDLCHVKLWPESPRVGFAKALRLIRDLGVEVVVCAPALCLSLAKAARYHGFSLAELPLKLFLVLGEICTPEFAANVSSLWPDATVAPILYGSQEALCIATGAPDGRLRLAEPNYVFELVDPSTGALIQDEDGSGAEGELVLTMLGDGIKPLIRYRTGDLVRIDPDPGSGPPGRVATVIGRAADRLRIGAATLHPTELEAAILHNVQGCYGYQVEISPTKVTVRLDLTKLPTPGTLDRLRTLVGPATPVHLEVEPELDPVTSTGAFVSWKAARVLDTRVAPDPADLAARAAAPRQTVTS